MPPETTTLAPARTRRLPRFRRASHEEQPAFRLTDRDRELLKIIYEYRFIDAEMLKDLVQPVALTPRQQESVARMLAACRTESTGTESPDRSSRMKRAILHRLMLLYHNGYVSRLKLSDSEPIIYALGNKGADELTLYYGVDRQKIDWQSKNRETSERYIRHGLMVSRFRHCLELALRDLPEASLLCWEPNGAFTALVEYTEATSTRDGAKTRRIKGTVIPDGYFALSYKGKTAHFFLEADRSTMSNARFLAKLKNYFHFYATQVRGKEHPSGMKGFAVLTITLSEERKQNLRRIARDVNAEGRGLNLWWFACERSYQGKPQELLGQIWQTAGDAENTVRSIF
jgi:hypothetical protein